MNEKQKFECHVCCLSYPTEDLAKQCEAWCGSHDSCNLEVIKHALAPTEEENIDQ